MASYDNKLVIGDNTNSSGELIQPIEIPILSGVRQSNQRWQGVSRALDGSFGVSDFGLTDRVLSFSVYACQYSDFTGILTFFNSSTVNYSQNYIYGSVPEDADSNQIFGLNATQYTFVTNYTGRNFQRWRLNGSGFDFESDTIGDFITIRFSFTVEP